MCGCAVVARFEFREKVKTRTAPLTRLLSDQCPRCLWDGCPVLNFLSLLVAPETQLHWNSVVFQVLKCKSEKALTFRPPTKELFRQINATSQYIRRCINCRQHNQQQSGTLGGGEVRGIYNIYIYIYIYIYISVLFYFFTL
jgi:hypothetical protein